MTDLTHPFRWEMVPFTRGDGIQVNVQEEKYFPHFLGVGASRLYVFAGGAFDFAVVDDLTETSVNDVWRVVKQGGNMVVIVSTSTPTTLPKGGWDWKMRMTHEDKVMLVFQKRSDKKQVESYGEEPDGKTACVVRYGAVGDMIQTSSVLARLRDMGFHNTLMCHSGNCFDVMEHDPNVDDFIIQDKDQVPQEWLGPYWTYWMGRFDKFVNLSGSVESTWLAIEHRYQFYWPQHVRHHYLNENYLEFMHRLAGVPLTYSPKFYPTLKEKEWADKVKRKIGGKIILWALAGSSCHKWWPHMDALIAKVMLEYPEWKVLLVGDEASQILETGWENEPRVIKKCGRWTYRQSLTFATKAADVVMGPETGILNAVSHLDVPTVAFLSHSSVDNLTRDWVNTVSLEPEGCQCFPCHILHTSGFKWCKQDDQTAASDCQVKITPAQAWEALNSIMRGL